jgi:UDP-N-acetylglucosamine 1-carboxyvinyltransferase
VEKFVVRSNGPLQGRVRISGAKNSALKLLAATLLAEGEHVLRNVPRIADVETMCDLLVSMGVDVQRKESETLVITRHRELHPEAPYELVERMRASVVVLGPLLAGFGRAVVSMPGGDDFGSRPIDDHLKGLEALGAEFTFSHGDIQGRVERLRGAHVLLEVPSHTATDTILMAAVLAEGTTVIENAAREPEVADLAAFLNRMGA